MHAHDPPRSTLPRDAARALQIGLAERCVQGSLRHLLETRGGDLDFFNLRVDKAAAARVGTAVAGERHAVPCRAGALGARVHGSCGPAPVPGRWWSMLQPGHPSLTRDLPRACACTVSTADPFARMTYSEAAATLSKLGHAVADDGLSTEQEK